MKITKQTHPEFFNLLLEDPEIVNREHRKGQTFYSNLYVKVISSGYFEKELGDKWSDEFLGEWISNQCIFSDSWGIEKNDITEFVPCIVEKVVITKLIYKRIKDDN